MGYHLKDIPKGTYGEFSKVEEEINELLDAAEQKNSVLMILELTDLMGAIDGFVKNKFNLSVEELVQFSKLTQSAFQEGKRK